MKDFKQFTMLLVLLFLGAVVVKRTNVNAGLSCNDCETEYQACIQKCLHGESTDFYTCNGDCRRENTECKGKANC